MRLNAFHILEADSLSKARRLARRQLRRARRCDRCRQLLARMFDQIGSTLFIDDDAEQLILAFDPAQRDADTLRTLAACIVLTGRPRLHPSEE
jgi:hypothetical protein